MTDKRIVFENVDGTIGIIIPAPKARFESETEDDFLDRIAEKDVPQGLDYYIVDADELPEDRAFREAWVVDGGAIDIDLDKAKDAWKEKLRQDRAPLLEALDIDFMRAVENSDTVKQNQVKDQKQVLRDITNLVDAAETLEDIKAITV